MHLQNGFTTTQLAAAGATNVAAMINAESLFNALSVEQRNTLRKTAYGDEAGMSTCLRLFDEIMRQLKYTSSEMYI